MIQEKIYFIHQGYRTPSDLGYKNANTNLLTNNNGIRGDVRIDNSHLGGYIYKFYIQDNDTIKKPSNYGNNNNINNKDAIMTSFDKKYGAIRSCCLNKKDEVFYGTSNGYVLKINDKSLGRLDQDRDENDLWTFNNNIQNNQPDYNISVVYSPSELIKEFIHKNKNLFKNNSNRGKGLHVEFMSYIGISSLQFDNNNKLYIVINKISIFRFDEKRNVMERIFNYNQHINNDILDSFVNQTNLENKLSNTTIDNTTSDLKINQFDFDKDNNLYFTSNSDYILKLNTETLKLSIFKNIVDSRKRWRNNKF